VLALQTDDDHLGIHQPNVPQIYTITRYKFLYNKYTNNKHHSKMTL